MEQRIRKALATARADYVDVRLNQGRGTVVSFVGRELENIGEHAGMGGCVRALRHGAWGFASFNAIDRLEEYVRIACDEARLLVGGTESMAPTPAVCDRVTSVLDEAPAGISLAEKKELCERYNRLLLDADKRIQTSLVRYGDSRGTVTFADSTGAFVVQEEAFTGIALTATARDGADVQSGHHSVADLRGFGCVRGLEAKCEEAARRAVDLLRARPVRGGRYTVILDPLLAGVFAHEAFGHLSEADFIYENERLREMMALGRRFGSELVTIIDDPTLPGEAGSYVYDDEGVRAQPTTLLSAGVLAGRLHSRETAATMGEAPTGNARALDTGFMPMVRMSNTYLVPGESSLDEMLAATPRGIYAAGFLGGETNMEMFTFSAEEARLIENGKLGRKVRDVTLTGNVFETLAAIDMVGGDLFHCGDLGGCGKGGQSPLRVSSGAPHVRVRNVLIGGGA